jgi:hypothetical protein
MGLNFYREDPRSPHMNLKLRPQPRRRSTRAGQVEPILLGEECSRVRGPVRCRRRRLDIRVRCLAGCITSIAESSFRFTQYSRERSRWKPERRAHLSTINFCISLRVFFGAIYARSLFGVSTRCSFGNDFFDTRMFFRNRPQAFYRHKALFRKRRSGALLTQGVLSEAALGRSTDTRCSFGSGAVVVPHRMLFRKRRGRWLTLNTALSSFCQMDSRVASNAWTPAQLTIRSVYAELFTARAQF